MIKSKWLLGCKTEKEKKERIALIQENTFLLSLLGDILKKDLKFLEKESEAKPRYESPNWAFEQADFNGSKRTYQTLLSLLTVTQEKQDD